MTPNEKIQSLAQGSYPELVQSAINAGASVDAFFADLVTATSCEPVTIISGQVLTAGEILFASVSTNVTADGGNTGNGTLTISAVGKSVVAGVYRAECVTGHPDRGIFELRRPDGGTVARINVGTALRSDDLNLTITDGSADFTVSDAFSVAVTIGGPFAAYSFESEVEQIAAAVLAADIDTTSGASQQFAFTRGPAILAGTFLHLPAWPGPPPSLDDFNSVMPRSIDQLALRGIVLR